MMWFRKVRLTSKSICLISDEKLFACSFICYKGEGQTRGRSQTPSQPTPLSMQREGVQECELHRAIAERLWGHCHLAACNDLQPGGESLAPQPCCCPRDKGTTPCSHATTAAAAKPAFAHLPMQIQSFQNLKPLQLNSTLISFDLYIAWLS